MSNILLRDSATASGSGNATVAVSSITGLQDGDLLTGWLSTDVPGTQTPPSGWTLQLEINHTGTNYAYHLYTKTASSESGSWVFDGGGGAAENNVVVSVYFDSTTSSPTWAITTPTSNEGTVASQTSAAITSTDNSFLLIGWGNDSAFTVTTPPASMTAAGFISALSTANAPYYEDIITGASETRTLVWSAVEQNVTIATVISSGTGGGGGFDFPFLEPQRIVRHDGRH